MAIYALQSDGASGSYIELATTIALPASGKCTFFTFVKATTMPAFASTQNHHIFCRRDRTGDTTRWWAFTIADDNGNPYYVDKWRYGGDSSEFYPGEENTTQAGVWYAIGFARDHTTDPLSVRKLAVDGVQPVTDADGGPNSKVPPFDGNSGVVATRFLNLVNPGATALGFNGAICNSAYWATTQLSQTELELLATGVSPLDPRIPFPSNYWIYNPSGGIYEDVVGGNHGTLNGNITVVAAPSALQERSLTTISGPFLFTSAANDNSFGTHAWTNPGNALTDNATRASNPALVTGIQGDHSQYLKMTGPAATLAAALPVGASPSQIVITVERRNTGHSEGVEEVNDSRVRLVVGGSIQTDDQANTTDWPASDTAIDYTFDITGVTRDQLIASDFGAVLAAVLSLTGGSSAVGVDVIYIKSVTYTQPAPTAVRGRSSVPRGRSRV